MNRLILPFLFAWLAAAGTPTPGTATKAIAERCKAAREYSFEGDLLLVGQRGSDPGKVLSQAKVKFAAAPDGKVYLRVEPLGKDAYVLISNGQKTWAWVPKLKQYTEEEGAILDESDSDDEVSDSERDLAETFVRQVMPALARLYADAQAADYKGEVPVKFEGRKANWPLLRVASKPAADKSITLTQLAVDPDTLAIGRMIRSTALRDAESTRIQMTIDFARFDTGPVPPSTFDFEPPKGTKLVESVPIPGQTGSALLNQPAPDFELKTLEGEKVRLADLRGRPVLLSFWASWCGPCRRELPELSALAKEYQGKGLVVFGVNDEGKGAARKFTEEKGLAFPTLDDSGLKAHRLFRVHAIPSLFLVDRDGKIVVFLRGTKEPAKLRAVLSAVGL